MEDHGYDVVGVFNGGRVLPAYTEGRWFTYTRENEGGSFGAFADAFEKMGGFYDWWMFQEDDVLVTDLSIFGEAVALMKERPKVGFVAFAVICTSPRIHAGGGFGVARVECLRDVAKMNKGRLPSAIGNYYPALEQAEIAFTGDAVECGWEIANLPGVSPFPENWRGHESFQNHAKKYKEGERYVYRVGL